MLFEAILSDNGAEVLLFYEGEDEPDTMPVEDFIRLYDANIIENYISVIGTRIYPNVEPDQFSISQYYGALVNTTYKNGDLARIIGLHAGTTEGNENAKKVAQMYYNGDDRKMVTDITARQQEYHVSLDILNYWSIRLGLGAIPSTKDGFIPQGKISREEFSRLMLGKKHFRSKIRRLADKYAKELMLLSLDDIVLEALISYNK